jgi:DNA-binding transcriptional LysR family regulator
MNLKQLEAFVHVAESRSFSKAAKALYLTQPTISAHVSALEKELKVRLFVRNTKEVNLSEDGKDLYKIARQIVDLEKKVEERFGIEEEGKQCVTIAASTIPSQYLLPGILLKFNERYPGEQLKLMETDSSGVVEQIVDHMADLGFTGTVLEKKHCKYIPFYKDELVIITPNTEMFRRRLEERPEDISWVLKEPVIMREEGSGTRREAEKQLRNAGVNPMNLNIVASIENQETIKKSVSQGMGISMLSKLATTEEVEAGSLLAFPIPKSDEGRDINLVYNKNYQLSKSAERFVKVVKELYDIDI